MRCRTCNSNDTRVISTFHKNSAVTIRYCRCLDCKARYQTIERYVIPKPGFMFGVEQNNNQARGERVSSSVLTEDNVREIRNLSAAKQTYVQIAKQFGIHKDTVYRIVNRKSWTHV